MLNLVVFLQQLGAHMYIRNLRKPSPNKNIFKFASAKNKDTIMCEGSLEKDCCYHFEYDSEVVSFESQPKGFLYDFDGKKLPYTPDFLVIYTDGCYSFVETKPYSKTLSKEFRLKFQARKQASKKLGFDLILVTDKQIRTGYFLKNSEMVHRYSGCIEGDTLTDTVFEVLLLSKTTKIYELVQDTGFSIGEVFASVLRLISVGKARANFDLEVLNGNSTIWVN
ncbi:Tn7 transposase TnsA N-terminal domain-containing protein [Vibrio cortegadensis]|uniref:Tn7 transposase TnsA N-terminal domain-containing protein n=1 Tax=Vibrio cortegadensis TaxID=1328770 RepID=UPI00352C3C78